MTEATVREIPDPSTDPTPQGQEPLSSFDSNPGDGQYYCEICGTVITTPSGRKPRVMRCDEHRKGKAGNKLSDTGEKPNNRYHAKIAEGMTACYTMIAFGVGAVYLPTQDPVWLKDKDTIGTFAPNIGEAWAKSCETNATMRKNVLKFLDSVGTLSLIAAHAPMIVSITQNHMQANSGANSGPVKGVNDNGG